MSYNFVTLDREEAIEAAMRIGGAIIVYRAGNAIGCYKVEVGEAALRALLGSGDPTTSYEVIDQAQLAELVVEQPPPAPR